MELLEGTTLRGKLDAGPIPEKQAVGYALQIAKGLSAAHEKGIVHRDLKPENLFVSKDGHLKILDFGLAKQTEQDEDWREDEPAHGLDGHRGGRRDGDAGLHVAGAGEGLAGGPPLGPLLVRGRPVRDALGKKGVQEGHGRRNDVGNPGGRAAGAFRARPRTSHPRSIRSSSIAWRRIGRTGSSPRRTSRSLSRRRRERRR